MDEYNEYPREIVDPFDDNIIMNVSGGLANALSGAPVPTDQPILDKERVHALAFIVSVGSLAAQSPDVPPMCAGDLIEGLKRALTILGVNEEEGAIGAMLAMRFVQMFGEPMHHFRD